jgi:hypothetical protein
MQNRRLWQKLPDLTVFVAICAVFQGVLLSLLRPVPQARYYRRLGPDQPKAFCLWIATLSAAIGQQHTYLMYS